MSKAIFIRVGDQWIESCIVAEIVKGHLEEVPMVKNMILEKRHYQQNRIGFLIDIGVSLAWWEKMFLRRMELKLKRGTVMSAREIIRADRIEDIIRLRKSQANDY